MLYVPTEFLDRCGVIISVANAFVEYKAEVYNLSLSEGSVGTDEWNKLLFAHCNKAGCSSEFVKMMIDRVDTKAAYIGDENAGMEGTCVVYHLGHKTDLVEIADGKTTKLLSQVGMWLKAPATLSVLLFCLVASSMLSERASSNFLTTS